MKIICLLLCFCVMLLSVTPCCTDSNCGGDITIIKTSHPSAAENACNGCSPFFVCGSCAGFVIAKPINYAVLNFSEIPLKHATTYQHPFIEDVSLAIWQPPQIG